MMFKFKLKRNLHKAQIQKFKRNGMKINKLKIKISNSQIWISRKRKILKAEKTLMNHNRIHKKMIKKLT